MGRKKKPQKEKNKIVPVSILPQQKDWIRSNPKFNFSKFCQVQLQSYIDFLEELKQSLIKLKEVKQ